MTTCWIINKKHLFCPENHLLRRQQVDIAYLRHNYKSLPCEVSCLSTLKCSELSDTLHVCHKTTFSESPFLNVAFLLPPISELQGLHSASFRKEVVGRILWRERQVGETEREKGGKEGREEGREGGSKEEGKKKLIFLWKNRVHLQLFGPVPTSPLLSYSCHSVLVSAPWILLYSLISLFCSLDSSYKWDHMVFFFHWGLWDWMKEGEGTGQRAYMHDPWTWTTVGGLTVGVGMAGGGVNGRKIGTSVIHKQ